MGEQVEFKAELEVKIWEVRKPRMTKKRFRAEPDVTYVRIGGEIFHAKGRLTRPRSGDCHVVLMHVLTGKHFVGCYGQMAGAIKMKKVKRLSEMEVIAWASNS